MKVLILIVLSAATARANPLKALISQWTIPRDCPAKINVVYDLDEEAYQGVWYEVERFEQPYQLNAECALVDYVRNANGSYTFLAQYQTNDIVVDPIGTGLFSHPNQKPKPAKMRVAFLGTQEETNYQILDTDYTHFVIIYNCIPVSAGKSYQSYWLLSRKPKLTKDPAVLERIATVKKEYIDQNHVRKTIQSKKLCKRSSGFRR